MRINGWRVFVTIPCLVLGLAMCGPAAPREETTPPPQGDPTPPPRTDPAPARPAAPAANTAGSCKQLFAKTTGKLDQGKISCIEDGFEKRNHDFDGVCNKLENAWALGSGGTDALWASCQSAEKFDDDDCHAVLAKCF